MADHADRDPWPWLERLHDWQREPVTLLADALPEALGDLHLVRPEDRKRRYAARAQAAAQWAAVGRCPEVEGRALEALRERLIARKAEWTERIAERGRNGLSQSYAQGALRETNRALGEVANALASLTEPRARVQGVLAAALAEVEARHEHLDDGHDDDARIGHLAALRWAARCLRKHIARPPEVGHADRVVTYGNPPRQWMHNRPLRPGEAVLVIREAAPVRGEEASEVVVDEAADFARERQRRQCHHHGHRWHGEPGDWTCALCDVTSAAVDKPSHWTTPCEECDGLGEWADDEQPPGVWSCDACGGTGARPRWYCQGCGRHFVGGGPCPHCGRAIQPTQRAECPRSRTGHHVWRPMDNRGARACSACGAVRVR